MRFSVIIPLHDSAATLAATLDSVLAQSFSDFETLIVDDASDDTSVEIAKRHPLPSRIIRLPANLGPGAARNAGAREAKGDYLTFLDSDDLWFPWTLAMLDTAIRSHPDASFIAGTATSEGQSVPPSNTTPVEPQISRYPNYFETAAQNLWIGVGGVAIKRSSFERVGGFAEWQANSEDSDLWLRLGTAPGFLEITVPPLFRYCTTEASLTRRPERIAPGYSHLIHQEKRAAYPGGHRFRRQRHMLLTRHTRAGSCELLGLGRFQQALKLYLATFFWNLRLLRIKYLLGFWIRALCRRKNRERHSCHQAKPLR